MFRQWSYGVSYIFSSTSVSVFLASFVSGSYLPCATFFFRFSNSFDVHHGKERILNPLTWKPKKLMRLEKKDANRNKKMRNIQKRQDLNVRKMAKEIRKEEREAKKEVASVGPASAGSIGKKKRQEGDSADLPSAKRIKKERSISPGGSEQQGGSAAAGPSSRAAAAGSSSRAAPAPRAKVKAEPPR